MRAVLVVALLFAALVPGTVAASERGDRGPEVTEVQTILSGFGYSVTVDGVFGPKTERAVKSWQKSNGLTVDGVAGPATMASLRGATRVGNAHAVGGLNGMPFAPDGLTGCPEMTFYREQAGLPEVFDALGYRESRCNNKEGPEFTTFCCYGYWQNYISSHLSLRSAYRVPIIERCQVRGVSDIDSDVPLDKQKQACVTAVLYSISGLTPWQ